MRICIYGAGAVGGYLTAGLADVEGIKVSAIARGAHLQAMRKRGLTLLSKDNKKTVSLCFNPISALTRATLDVVASRADSCHTARKLMEEAERIALALGAEFRVDIDRRINGAAKVGAHRTSMLQDLEGGKPMEIDALISSVQELGRITDIATPVIDVVLGLVRQLGRSQGLYPTFPETATDAKQVA